MILNSLQLIYKILIKIWKNLSITRTNITSAVHVNLTMNCASIQAHISLSLLAVW